MGPLFASIRDGLSRAGAGLLGALAGAAAGQRSLTGGELEALEERLLAADVGVAASERLLAAVKRDGGQAAIDALRNEMLAILATGHRIPEPGPGGLQVWLVSGVNGSGKTTTVGKLGRRFAAAGLKVMFAAADTYRAAAGEQLEIWARRAGAALAASQPGADPSGVAFDAVAAAQARGADVLLVDTAGRLHNRQHLQDELKKIRTAVGRRLPGAPHCSLLVMDATTGQSGLSQARLFLGAAAMDGIILTKLDGTAKGGIVLAIAQELGIPVSFVGAGEGPDDLWPFDAREFVDGILGGGAATA